MTQQRELIFDAAAGERAKVRGQDRAAAGVAGSEWAHEATRAVLDLALQRHTFTTDDVWGLLQARGIGRPSEPRALGSIFRDLARRLLIVQTGDYTKTAIVAAHGRPISVWRRSILTR